MNTTKTGRKIVAKNPELARAQREAFEATQTLEARCEAARRAAARRVAEQNAPVRYGRGAILQSR